MKRHNGDDEKDEVQAPGSGDEVATGLEAAPARDEDVEAVRREAADLRDQLLRKRAEFENYKRRTEREREQIGLEKAAQVLKGLVPTIDNLERALAAATEDDPLRQGVELTRKELMTLLEANGVTVEDPIGLPFDPLRHQALAMEPAPGHAEGTILEVFRKGYVLKDRLLRPALVKVAQGAGDHEGDSRGEKVH